MTALGKGVFVYAVVLVGLVLAVGSQVQQKAIQSVERQMAAATPGLVPDPVGPSSTTGTADSPTERPAWQRDSTSPDAIPLEQAIGNGSVEASIHGLGGSTGDTILITLRRRTPKTLRIVLTPGTVFTSKSDAVQNMVAASIRGERTGQWTYRPTSEIVLEDGNEHRYVVEAYCMDFHKRNPSQSSVFTLAPPNEAARRIVQAGKEMLASNRAIQAALWIVRDGIQPSELKKKFPVSDQELDAAWQILREGPRNTR